MIRAARNLGAAMAVTLLVWATGPQMAAAQQSGFDSGSFGGSFETGDAPATGSQPAPGGFGGSFDNPTQPAGSEGTAGSFDPDFMVSPPGPAVSPNPQPQPAPQPQPVTQPSPQQPAGQPDIQLDPQILAFETRDFGVPPTGQLRQGQFHAATPVAIPGGYLASTEALATAMNNGLELVLIDVLGGEYSLPGALVAPAMASSGGYSDRIQQQAAQWLGQLTGGDPEFPVVIYCSDPKCWLSYNASLRAIAAGYTNVYWYRGGLQAWQMSGLPVAPSGF